MAIPTTDDIRRLVLRCDAIEGRHARLKRWTVILGVFALAAAVVAGVLAVQLTELQDEESALDNEVEDIESNLDSSVEAAVKHAAATAGLSGRLNAMDKELAHLDEVLFGFAGAPAVERDMLTELRQDIEDAVWEINGLRSCFNDALWDSFDSFSRYVFNDCALRYTVSSC